MTRRAIDGWVFVAIVVMLVISYGMDLRIALTLLLLSAVVGLGALVFMLIPNDWAPEWKLPWSPWLPLILFVAVFYGIPVALHEWA